jgi:hypothetical protein
MAGAHDEAVGKWGTAAVVDLFSAAQLAASLNLQVTGSGLTFALEAGIEISEITALGAFGIVSGGIALAALPVVATGLIIALATHDEKTSHELLDASDMLPYMSGGTLLAVGMSAPLMAFSSSQDPLLPARVAGGLIDFAAGVFDPDASPLSLLRSGESSALGASDWYRDAQTLYGPLFQSPAYPSTPNAPQPSQGNPGQPVQGASPGSMPPGPIPTDFGPTPSMDDFYPFMPGMGDFGSGTFGSSTSGASGDPLTMTMTVNVPTGYGSGSAPGNSAGDDNTVNNTPSDCQEDCSQPTPTPTPPSDCADCSHDCSDCVHDCECADCEC